MYKHDGKACSRYLRVELKSTFSIPIDIYMIYFYSKLIVLHLIAITILYKN